MPLPRFATLRRMISLRTFLRMRRPSPLPFSFRRFIPFYVPVTLSNGLALKTAVVDPRTSTPIPVFLIPPRLQPIFCVSYWFLLMTVRLWWEMAFVCYFPFVYSWVFNSFSFFSSPRISSVMQSLLHNQYQLSELHPPSFFSTYRVRVSVFLSIKTSSLLPRERVNLFLFPNPNHPIEVRFSSRPSVSQHFPPFFR